VNVLLVDTEMYSITGGQCSKATPSSTTVKFASGGKQQKKKSIGEIFMMYEHVYIASVAISNHAQLVQAFIKADKHDGPSIIIAYAPCIQNGVHPQGLNDMYEEARFAVESGYWPLYRYNPSLVKEGKNPFIYIYTPFHIINYQAYLTYLLPQDDIVLMQCIQLLMLLHIIL
jgi:pyruvate-ferredoxin/flavodoxin oxidoreductase